MTGFGPLTVGMTFTPAGPNTNGAAQALDTGVLTDSISYAECTATISGTNSTSSSGTWDIYATCFNAGNVEISTTNLGTKWVLAHPTDTLTWNLPEGAHRVRITGVAALLAGSGGSFTFNGSYTTQAADYCTYGTTIIPASGLVLAVSGGVIAAAAATIGAPVWLSAAMGSFAGTTVNLGVICNGPPPPMPVFDPDTDLILGRFPNPASAGKFWQALIHASWPLWCQCTPAPSGSPAPTPYPVTPFVPPPGVSDDPPGIVCDAEDICGTLNQITQVITNNFVQNNIQNNLDYSTQTTINGDTYETVQNIAYDLSTTGAVTNNIDSVVQNIAYDLSTTNSVVTNIYTEMIRRNDFQYGDVHADLSGAGTFNTAPGILGLLCEVTGDLSDVSTRMGNPTNYHTECHVSFGTDSGWYHTVGLRMLDEMLVAPPWTTRVAWHTVGDLELDITELVPVVAP